MIVRYDGYLAFCAIHCVRKQNYDITKKTSRTELLKFGMKGSTKVSKTSLTLTRKGAIDVYSQCFLSIASENRKRTVFRDFQEGSKRSTEKKYCFSSLEIHLSSY